jgi:putative FmdB family regulatory protein
MPIYEYECKACENVFEVQQRMTDEPLRECPDCRGAVKKLVSVSSFQLKGGGWYSDGYSSTSNGKGKNGESVAKKETPATPPCQKSGAEGCKSCPAAAV